MVALSSRPQSCKDIAAVSHIAVHPRSFHMILVLLWFGQRKQILYWRESPVQTLR